MLRPGWWKMIIPLLPSTHTHTHTDAHTHTLVVCSSADWKKDQLLLPLLCGCNRALPLQAQMEILKVHHTHHHWMETLLHPVLTLNKLCLLLIVKLHVPATTFTSFEMCCTLKYCTHSEVSANSKPKSLHVSFFTCKIIGL